MSKKFDNIQVVPGRGRKDTGALHRALDVARQMVAAGVWNGQGKLIVHQAYELHYKLQRSGEPEFNREEVCNVYPGVYELVEGQDYEIQPPLPGLWGSNDE